MNSSIPTRTRGCPSAAVNALNAVLRSAELATSRDTDEQVKSAKMSLGVAPIRHDSFEPLGFKFATRVHA